MPKKKKKPLAKNKKMNTKISVRRRNLKKQVKTKFGNALAPCLTQLSTDELANLLTGHFSRFIRFFLFAVFTRK